MGGPTGKTIAELLKAMYEAEFQGAYARNADLAARFGVKPNTISTHFKNLGQMGLILEDHLLRGLWRLTLAGKQWVEEEYPAFVAELLRRRQRRVGVPFRGEIAAGPALQVQELGDETIVLPQYDDATHFALRVRGTSMTSFGIRDRDIVICRKVHTWLEVPDGKIVAARVPEGTGDDEHWIERLARRYPPEGVHEPILDHTTLKQFTARVRAYVSAGVTQDRITADLRGSQRTFHPVALAIDGVVVYRGGDY